jgi:hypothetical protein
VVVIWIMCHIVVSYLCHTDVSPACLNLLQELLLIHNDVLESSIDNFLEEHEIALFISVLSTN